MSRRIDKMFLMYAFNEIVGREDFSERELNIVGVRRDDGVLSVCGEIGLMWASGATPMEWLPHKKYRDENDEFTLVINFDDMKLLFTLKRNLCCEITADEFMRKVNEYRNYDDDKIKRVQLSMSL